MMKTEEIENEGISIEMPVAHLIAQRLTGSVNPP